MKVGCGWKKGRKNEGGEVEWKVEKVEKVERVGRGKPLREEASARPGGEGGQVQSKVSTLRCCGGKRQGQTTDDYLDDGSTTGVKRLKAEGGDQAVHLISHTQRSTPLLFRGVEDWREVNATEMLV